MSVANPICSKCQSINLGNKFCTTCGNNLQEQSVNKIPQCPKCNTSRLFLGILLDPLSRFCGECGYDFKSTEAMA